MHKYMVMAFVCMGALLIAFFTVRSEKHEPVVVRQVPQLAPEAPSTPTTVQQQPGFSSLNRESKPNGYGIADLYKKIQNGRVFVLDAWSRPQEGGRFYAARLVDRCAGVKKFTEFFENPQPDLKNVESENQVKATSAINHFLSLCGQFTDEELKKYSSSSLFLNENETDVLVKLYRQTMGDKFSKAESSKKLVLNSLIESADPLIVDELGVRILRDSKTNGIYLDGKSYRIQEAEEVLAAYYLLPCGLGLNCSATDPSLALSCASGGNCFESRFDKARLEMVGGNHEKYQRVLTLYESMLAAFKNKNTSFFTQP